MSLPRPISTAAALVLALTAALLLVACGDDDSATSEGERAVGPQGAIAEIAEVRKGLAAGLAAYEDGEAERAEELVAEAYLEHFELVEGPLEERDEELNEELEELIREQLRDEIAAGAPVAAVRELVREAERELDRAEAELEG